MPIVAIEFYIILGSTKIF